MNDLFHLPAVPILNVTSMFAKLRAGYSFEEASAVSTEPTLYWDTVTAFLDKYVD